MASNMGSIGPAGRKLTKGRSNLLLRTCRHGNIDVPSNTSGANSCTYHIHVDACHAGRLVLQTFPEGNFSATCCGQRHTFICVMALAFCIRASQVDPNRRKIFIMPLMDCAPVTVTFARLVGAPVVDAGMLYLMIGIVVGCSFSASSSNARYCPWQHTLSSSKSHAIKSDGKSMPSTITKQLPCGIQAGLRGCRNEKSVGNRS